VNYNKKPLNIALTLALVGITNTTSAQEHENKGALEVIEVTAQKRVQNLQELPTAVTVFNSDSIRNKGITDVEDLSAYTPNMQISENPGSSTSATIAIRGSVTINPAITWETTTGVYVYGVLYQKVLVVYLMSLLLTELKYYVALRAHFMVRILSVER